MGGSVGKILGAVAGVALAPVTGGASLALAGLGGAAAGELLVDKPAREAKKAEQQAQAQAEQAKADALAAAQATRESTTTGAGVLERRGATALGEQDAKDKRTAVRKKSKGAAKLRIDPMAASSAAAGTATSGDTGLKV